MGYLPRKEYSMGTDIPAAIGVPFKQEVVTADLRIGSRRLHIIATPGSVSIWDSMGGDPERPEFQTPLQRALGTIADKIGVALRGKLPVDARRLGLMSHFEALLRVNPALPEEVNRMAIAILIFFRDRFGLEIKNLPEAVIVCARCRTATVIIGSQNTCALCAGDQLEVGFRPASFIDELPPCEMCGAIMRIMSEEGAEGFICPNCGHRVDL